MSESARIAELMERAYRGKAWHGPSVLEALDGVDAMLAFERPLDGAHTILELTRHILVWLDVVIGRVESGSDEPVPPERDWPDTTGDNAHDEQNWNALKQRLEASHKRALVLFGSLPEERLSEDLPQCEPSQMYLVLHGVIHHHLYHAGQIQMLKRSLQARSID